MCGREQPGTRTDCSHGLANNLYIGAHLFDRDPSGIKGFQRRDAALGSDDRSMWILDTFLHRLLKNLGIRE